MIKAKGNTKLYNLDQQQRRLIAQQWREGYVRIEDYKFGKGKPRNALKPLLQSNKKEGDVTRASMLAFNFAESSIADKTTKVVTTIMCKKKSITRSDLICLSLAVDYV
jgi:hypothetical protein